MNIFKITWTFLRHISEKRYLVYELTMRDFKGKYISNVLGLVWAVLEPLAFMLILWLIFGLGLRGGKSMEIPFILYLISGLAVYLFFSQTLTEATMAIKGNSFLLKKVHFRFDILPLVKILSGIIVHFIVLSIVASLSLFKGKTPNIYWLQIPYYTFSLSAMILGISWATSSVVLFIPDISNFIQILLRFFFYLSPIFWQIKIFPENLHGILKINPIYYIMEGYRNSLYYGIPFWQDWKGGLLFWGITVVFLLVGMVTFKKLQPHFGDVA